jgi:hypothetical protein
MLKNKLHKLRILGISLLLSMGYNTVRATASSDEAALKAEAVEIDDNLRKWQAAGTSSEEKAVARKFLGKKGIFVEDLYRQEDIDRAWEDDLKEVTQSVVRVNQECFENYSTMDIGTGTGTLIDVGLPELQGRVVLTCAHVAVPNRTLEYRYLSISEILKICNTIVPMGTTLQLIHLQASVENVITHKKECFEFNDNKFVRLTITPECQRGIAMNEVLISDIYLLTTNDAEMNSYDICVAILEEPVRFNGEIIPGVPLARLNVMYDIRVADESPYHLSWQGSSRNGSINDVSPIVIGYGNTGYDNNPKLSIYLASDTVKSIIGSGSKKSISFR